MPFMEQQITKKMTWFQVETNDITRGTVSYPGDEFNPVEVAKLESVEVDEVKEVKGYGARMSAPGYSDCTEWSVYDTPEAAKADLDEYYGDDEDEEEDED